MKIFNRVILYLSCLLLSAIAFAANPVALLKVSGPIGPATQDYIERSLQVAEKDNAALVILKLDTPGGLATSMRGINKAILTSKVPVATYVSPSGAHAASAGTFILYASHIAAMAPGTNLGSASPVGLGTPLTDEKSNNKPSAMEKKVMNDAAAYIKSLADLRNRNAIWAEKAVRQAESLTASAALKQNVINFMADSDEDVIEKSNGKIVKLEDSTTTINTSDVTVKHIKPDLRSEILSVITSPSIAYILLLIGILGIFFEFSNPGFVLPGVVGAISLLVALYALQLLPISYTGLALLLLGIIFIITEALIPSFGIIGFGGIIAFGVGSFMLFDGRVPGFSIAISVIITMCIITVLIVAMVAYLAYGSLRRPVVTGREALYNSEGEVTEIYDNRVIVRVKGETWTAKCKTKLNVGDKIKVMKLSKLVLTVKPINKG